MCAQARSCLSSSLVGEREVARWAVSDRRTAADEPRRVTELPRPSAEAADASAGVPLRSPPCMGLACDGTSPGPNLACCSGDEPPLAAPASGFDVPAGVFGGESPGGDIAMPAVAALAESALRGQQQQKHPRRMIRQPLAQRYGLLQQPGGSFRFPARQQRLKMSQFPRRNSVTRCTTKASRVMTDSFHLSARRSSSDTSENDCNMIATIILRPTRAIRNTKAEAYAGANSGCACDSES